MKLHEILLIATIGTLTITLLGFLGVAYGLETPKMIFDVFPRATQVLGCSTAVCWLVGKVARAVL